MITFASSGWKRCVLLLVMVGVFAATALAQGTASISGRAVDAGGASVPDASVTVTNVDNGEVRTVPTDPSGLYRVLSLPVGKYDLKLEKTGFQTELKHGVNLVVGQEAVVDFSLQVGAINQEVTVSAEALTVNTTTEQTSGLVGEQEVKDLPLNGRSFDNLITLNAGSMDYRSMHTTSNAYTGGFGNSFSISGHRTNENVFILNGVEYVGNGIGSSMPGGVSGQLLGIDAIREFNVLVDSYGTQYGKRAGAQINVVTMSGTNTLHGSAFDFLRNSDLDARNFFDTPPSQLGSRIPHFVRNNYGGSLGGPVRKDKVFVFGNYEGLRQLLGLSNVALVPDNEARMGFLPCGTATDVTCNTATGLANVGVNAGIAPYMVLYPIANGPDIGGGEADFFNSPIQRIREDFGTARADYVISDKDTISGIFTIDDGVSNTPTVTDTFNTNIALRNQVTSITETHIFSPTLINTLTGGFSRSSFVFQSIPLTNYPASLSFVQGDIVGTLATGTNGGTGNGALSAVGGGSPASDSRNVFTEADSVQLVKGIHLFNFGVWAEEIQDNALLGANIGSATITSLETLLKGQATSIQANASPAVLGFRTKEGAWYVQDTIKLRPNLTVNAGLRHEFSNGWNEALGRMSNFIPGQYGVLGASPQIGYNAFTVNNERLLFQPRLGLAWDPFGDGKTAIHAGFGMYETMMDDLTSYPGRNPPFNRTIQISNAQFPITQITPANGLTLPGAAISANSLQPDFKAPTYIQYTLKIERSITPSTVVSIGYVGNHGYHNIGQIDPNTAFPLVCGAATQPYPVPAAAVCPTAATIAANPVVTPTGNTVNLYPNGFPAGTLFYGYGSKVAPIITVARRQSALSSSKEQTSTSNDEYNGMTLEVVQRLSHGLSFKANFTWSSNEDEDSANSANNNCASTLADDEQIKTDWGPSCFNITDRVSFNGSYELPFGKGRYFWNNASGIADKLVGGWQLNSILSLQTGLPFDPELGFSQSGNLSTVNTERPQWDPLFHGSLYEDNPNQWFNPNAFMLPYPGTYGNVGRNVMIGPGIQELDLSMLKHFPITEKYNLEFRAEAFNILNHANFGVPGELTLNSNGTARSTAGVITATTTTSRQMQFGLKLVF